VTEHGTVVYLEIPTSDVEGSAQFYGRVFGWRVRTRSDGELAFDDATGNVSGSWRLGRPPQPEPGVLVYINVEDVTASIAEVEAAGGRITQGLGGDPGELTARFRDPYGNLLALYQEPVA
jgi:uncharacterized protein